MTYTLRYMDLEDISQVVEVDKLSFPMPWSSRSYIFEISDNQSSHMVTLELGPAVNHNGGLLGALRRLSGQPRSGRVAGYGGFWYIDGEAHISTIAIHPDLRGKGLGEVLLAGMLARSIILKAEYAVLEVRVSNETAINLYKKYEFDIVGERKKYYRDNNEDAYLMHLAPLDEAYQARFVHRLEQLRARVPFTDLLTQQTVR